jgi:uncharacterized membrane protein
MAIENSAAPPEHMRFHASYVHLASPFGEGGFGAFAERIARFFGTPRYLIGQTVAVLVWIALNSIGVIAHWDPYPFILLNLAFSLQAAYAAPLILLAQTRQADRDKALADADARHREALAAGVAERQQLAENQVTALNALLEQNTRLTEQVEKLAEQIRDQVARPPAR